MMQNQIVEMMHSTKDTFNKNVLKVLVAEFQRGKNKEINDSEVIGIIKSMIKNSNISLQHSRDEIEKENNTNTINFLTSLLPINSTVSEFEVEEWIKTNIDFTQFKNKMQAMKIIMQHFGSSVEGSTVKSIIEKL